MKPELNKTTHILLLGGDVRSNMGDRAIRQSLIQMIHGLNRNVVIHALSKAPEKDEQEFSIQPIGRSVISLFTRLLRLRKMDLAIWGGGQLLQDDTSLAKNLYWAVILTWVNCILGIPIIGIGVGIGPLNTRTGKAFARAALKNLTSFVGRDPQTCEWARNLGPGRMTIVQAPDLAVYLEPASAEDAWNYLENVEGINLNDDEIVVGVSIRRWFHLKQNQIIPYEWYSVFGAKKKRENMRFESFLTNLSAALRKFGENRKVRLLFFPMSHLDWEGDAQFSGQIAKAAGLPAHILKLECDASMVKALTGLCNFFVSVRMHSAILAMSMGVPSAGIVHVPKTSHFYNLLGQGDFLLDMESAAEINSGDVAVLSLMEKTFLCRQTSSMELLKQVEKLANQKNKYENLLKRNFSA